MNVKAINGNTQILAVFGYPIAHSLSPAMHNAAFQELGMNCVYIPCAIPPTDIDIAVRAIKVYNFKGVNVTIPHKQAVLNEIDQLFGDSLYSGSVNTIINRGGKLLGTSTDGIGLVRSLREEGHFEPAGKNVVLLGAGGSAAAVVYALIAAGIGGLTVVNRDLTKAAVLQEQVRNNTGFNLSIMGLHQLARVSWEQTDLLINSTSVGLNDNTSLVPVEFLKPGMCVFDLVYKPGGTVLVNQAIAAGNPVLDGLSMLLYQGVESFKLWFEIEPPIKTMRKAIGLTI